MRIVGVGEITRYLKDLFGEDPYLSDVWVRGEITGYAQPASGHRYFSLKDETAQLRCVFFRQLATYAPPLRNGMAVLAHGRLSVYEARGEYQLYVDAVEDAGIGLLHLRFEELKARLEAEGLFEGERKRPIPARPSCVGVVTSASGAALRDIVRTLRQRCPLVHVIIAPALVQGEGAAAEVAAALDALNAHGGADVAIVARGGGSLEDLWAFNEEPVARAIYRSRLPVITGVGHETDFTIADFVADHRASTPTAAAMACVPDAREWRRDLAEMSDHMTLIMRAQVESARDFLALARRDLLRASPATRIASERQRVDDATHNLSARIAHYLELRHERLRGAALHLHSLSPLLTIGRGFAVVRREPEGQVVTSVGQVPSGQGLSIQVADGRFAAVAVARIESTPDVEGERRREGPADSGVNRPRPPRRTPLTADTLPSEE
jgi:exodeoxyribonuclease VII large subunit